MSDIKKLLLVFLFQFLGIWLFGQHFESWIKDEKLTNYREIKKAAKQAEQFENKYLALALYEKLHQLKPDNLEVIEKCAQLSSEVNHLEKSLNYTALLLQADSQTTHFIDYALLLKTTENVDSSKQILKFLIDQEKAKNISKNEIKRIENIILGIEIQQQKDSLISFPFRREELKTLNGNFSELSPKILHNKLYFIGYKVNTNVLLQTERFMGQQQVIISATFNGTQWVFSDSITFELSQPETQFLGSISPVTDSLFLVSVCSKNFRGITTCALNWATLANGKLHQFEVLPSPINQPEFISTQPFGFLIEDKIGIYFSSNMPGSKGKMDIWYTEFKPESETFSGVRNLGNKINSEFNELFPTYRDSTLFFTADYEFGLGGYDIYKAKGVKTKFNSPVNFLEVNSTYHDLAFTPFKDTTHGIILSNKPNNNQVLGEGCCDDLYAVKIENVNEKPLYISVYSQNDDKIIAENNVAIHTFLTSKKDPSLTDTLNEGILKLKLDTTLQWQFRLMKQGYFTQVMQFSTAMLDTVDEEHPLKIEIQKIPTGEILLKDIYYEFDSPELTPKAKVTIENTIFKILLYNPELKVQINSHTDSKGKLAYNYKLSKMRAQSVVRYLVELGINSEQLQFKGYGETKPVAPNFLPDGTDNPEGRALNRRTTFTVVGY